jgi:crotonobetainyl-CoA:carnitine CoA-transferase CaiB-like acyl-CoA transferase
VNTIDRVFSDPQVLHREMVKDAAHPGLGHLKQLSLPFKCSSWGFEVERVPPLKGEHTAEILAEIGYGEDRIKELRESGIVS